MSSISLNVFRVMTPRADLFKEWINTHFTIKITGVVNAFNTHNCQLLMQIQHTDNDNDNKLDC